MEFHQNEECPVSLMEMRFHIPLDPEDENGGDAVEAFKEAVLKYAGVVEDHGRKPLTTFKDIFCNTPRSPSPPPLPALLAPVLILMGLGRGKYEFSIYPTHLSLHGKTYDYKIPNNTILRMFLLQHRDGIRMYFVVSAVSPLPTLAPW